MFYRGATAEEIKQHEKNYSLLVEEMDIEYVELFNQNVEMFNSKKEAIIAVAPGIVERYGKEIDSL